jgi:branched-chain amino acid transport system ATP-binding protein
MLEIDNLHVRYGSITALRGVSLQVAEGEIVALIGVNGAGKSTMMMTIAGVLKPSSGDIRFRGESLTRLAPEEIVRRGIALVPEERRIFPRLTVEENLRLGAAIYHDRAQIEADIEEMYELFPVLGERSGQLGGTLSGGEQQQLAIARGMMSRPALLLLDEPSLGLAPLLVDEIFRLVSTLHEKGVTILLVEQNVERTLQIADRAYLLETGLMKFEGPAHELSERVDIAQSYLGGAG